MPQILRLNEIWYVSENLLPTISNTEKDKHQINKTRMPFLQNPSKHSQHCSVARGNHGDRTVLGEARGGLKLWGLVCLSAADEVQRVCVCVHVCTCVWKCMDMSAPK